MKMIKSTDVRYSHVHEGYVYLEDLNNFGNEVIKGVHRLRVPFIVFEKIESKLRHGLLLEREQSKKENISWIEERRQVHSELNNARKRGDRILKPTLEQVTRLREVLIYETEQTTYTATRVSKKTPGDTINIIKYENGWILKKVLPVNFFVNTNRLLEEI